MYHIITTLYISLISFLSLKPFIGITQLLVGLMYWLPLNLTLQSLLILLHKPLRVIQIASFIMIASPCKLC